MHILTKLTYDNLLENFQRSADPALDLSECIGALSGALVTECYMQLCFMNAQGLWFHWNIPPIGGM